MQMKREVGQKGQIVLPKDVRDYLNIKPGSRIILEIRGTEVVLKPERTADDFVDYFSKTLKKPRRRISMRTIKKALEEEYDLR